jgi:LacI family transcriptional regulator
LQNFRWLKDGKERLMKRPTQVDVARIAGVSRATVSLVINDQRDGRVPISEETRARVLAAIQELGYEPDASARALRSGGTNIIGFVIPTIENPHFWDTVDGVTQEARSRGYHLLFSNLSSRFEFSEVILRDLLSQRIDGLILPDAYIDKKNRLLLGTSFQTRLAHPQVPIVEISDDPDVEHPTDTVQANYRQATREIIAHLVSMGHRRFGFINGVAFSALGVDRLRAYEEAHQAAGLPVDPQYILTCGDAIEDGYQAALQLLQLPERPTTILAINDLLAIGAVRAAADLGLRIPADLSLVGFDDIPIAKYLVPRLTTVSKDAVGLGRAAARMLIERIQNPDLPRRTLTSPARIIYRESTGPAPAQPTLAVFNRSLEKED